MSALFPKKLCCFFGWCFYFYFLFQTLFFFFAQFLFSLSISKALSMYLPWHSSFIFIFSLNLLKAHFNFMRQLLCANLFQKKGSIDDNGKGNKMLMMKKKKKKHWKSRTSVVIIFIMTFHSVFQIFRMFLS